MTNEEKLKVLLDKAVENGFNINILPFTVQNWNIEVWETDIKYYYCYEGDFIYSLNDLVLNTNFIQCLCNKNVTKNTSTLYFFNSELSLVQAFKAEWAIIEDPEKRLEWLFKQFNL